MRDHGQGGSIVNIASITGLRVAGAISAYVASKAGLIQLTKAMALELARCNIRVNALAPGYIETDINRDFFSSDAGQALIKRIPQRRIGKAEELDGPLLLLCSDASSYMTGSVLVADGGIWSVRSKPHPPLAEDSPFLRAFEVPLWRPGDGRAHAWRPLEPRPTVAPLLLVLDAVSGSPWYASVDLSWSTRYRASGRVTRLACTTCRRP
jgi:hypothetical protein